MVNIYPAYSAVPNVHFGARTTRDNFSKAQQVIHSYMGTDKYSPLPSRVPTPLPPAPTDTFARPSTPSRYLGNDRSQYNPAFVNHIRNEARKPNADIDALASHYKLPEVYIHRLMNENI